VGVATTAAQFRSFWLPVCYLRI